MEGRMPTYEYVCLKCEHHFDKFQRMTDKALTVCLKESCPRKPWGKGKVKRVVSAGAGIIFKGSGFYETDYRSENYKAGAKKEAGSGSTDTTKKDTKPAPAKESKPTSSGAASSSTGSSSAGSSSTKSD